MGKLISGTKVSIPAIRFDNSGEKSMMDQGQGSGMAPPGRGARRISNRTQAALHATRVCPIRIKESRLRVNARSVTALVLRDARPLAERVRIMAGHNPAFDRRFFELSRAPRTAQSSR
jgi:hypothetical protein